MSSQEVTQKQSGGLASSTSDVLKTTQETVTSAAASLSGALSGSLSAGAHSSSKKTTTTSSGGTQVSKQEADQLYQERIEAIPITDYSRVGLEVVMTPNLTKAFELIDAAHSEDPKSKTSSTGESIPYELHYAKKMTHYLSLHTPNPSPLLATACRAQHFRRWEVPRDTYPRTKAGYFAWRTFLKKRQAEQVQQICLQCEYTEEEASHVAALIAKEDLKKGEGKGDPEAQVLEDVACLVFLDDQFDEFEKGHDEEKIVGILQKTWVKMGDQGRQLALQMDLSERAKEMIGKALGQ